MIIFIDAKRGMEFVENEYLFGTVSLKPELFEGMRFDFNKGLSPKFSLSHR